MITSTGLNTFGQAIVSSITNGAAITDGATQTVDIYKTEIVGSEVKVYLLFDGNYAGRMTKFQLRDISNKVLIEQPDDIQKVYNKLLLVTFKISLSERVVTS